MVYDVYLHDFVDAAYAALSGGDHYVGHGRGGVHGVHGHHEVNDLPTSDLVLIYTHTGIQVEDVGRV